jgi:hypothetical protein
VVEIADVGREILDAAVGCDEAGLFLVAGAEADEFHRHSFRGELREEPDASRVEMV